MHADVRRGLGSPAHTLGFRDRQRRSQGSREVEEEEEEEEKEEEEEQEEEEEEEEEEQQQQEDLLSEAPAAPGLQGSACREM